MILCTFMCRFVGNTIGICCPVVQDSICRCIGINLIGNRFDAYLQRKYKERNSRIESVLPVSE